MKCPNCMQELKPGNRFCTSCGTPIPTQAPPPQRTETIIVKESSNGKVAVIIILSMLLTITIGVLIFFAVTSLSSSSKTEPEPTVEVWEDTVSDDASSFENTTSNGDYIFPSDRQYITASDLAGLSQQEVAMIRNEIYARHGYMFHKEPFKSYFGAKSWYTPNPNFSEDMFSSIEEVNKNFIIEYERSKGWR